MDTSDPARPSHPPLTISLMNDAQLVEAWEQVQKRVEAAGWAVFPAIPDDPQVSWPNDDWSVFLDVAEAVGTKLIYLVGDTVGEDRIREIEELEGDLDPELSAALAAARVHGGRVCGFNIGFVVGPLFHWFWTEAPWCAAIDEAPVSEGRALPWRRRGQGSPGAPGLSFPEGDLDGDYDVDRGLDWLEGRRRFEEAINAEQQRLAPQVETWVAVISTHPEYLAARNETERRVLAGRLVPGVPPV